MDDIFSSIDVHVIEKLFDNAIRKFLIQKGKTVLMATN